MADLVAMGFNPWEKMTLSMPVLAAETVEPPHQFLPKPEIGWGAVLCLN